MTLQLRVGARSDVGLVREGNEDALYAGRRLLAVADGVGGSVAGEIASSLTIHALEPLEDEPELRDPLGSLREAVHRANDSLRDRIEHDPELAGMGTTLTAMLWHHERLGLAQVGDSRAYLLRDGDVSQITRDQTFVQMLVEEGRITAEQAAHHPQRSVILNALDGRGDVEPDLSLRDVEPGDRYLLCSDGLSDYVPSDALAAGLAGGDPQPACDRLVELALQAGAPDNVTCIVVDVVETDTAPPDSRLPIVGGAAAENPTATIPATDSVEAERGGRPRGIGRRLGIVAAAVVVLIALAIVGSLIYVHHQWYVATANPGGTVGVYQGVQGSVLGHDLSHLHSPSNLPVTALPEDDADQVRGVIQTGSLAKAQAIVAGFRHDACATATAPVTPSPGPTHGHERAASRPVPAPTPSWCLP